MIGHEDERVDPPASAGAGLAERGEKQLPIRIAAEDRLLPVATIQHMVDRPFKFDTRLARHLSILPLHHQGRRAKCRDYRIDPFRSPDYFRSRARSGAGDD